MQFTQLASPHEAGINDIVFDYYGKRLASCSSDKRIKIYDFNEKNRSWENYDISRAHDGVIWRLSWAHPEFGQVRYSWCISIPSPINYSLFVLSAYLDIGFLFRGSNCTYLRRARECEYPC